MGSNTPRTQKVQRDIFQIVKRPEPYGNHSSLSSSDVTNEWRSTSTASILLRGWFEDSITLVKYKHFAVMLRQQQNPKTCLCLKFKIF